MNSEKLGSCLLSVLNKYLDPAVRSSVAHDLSKIKCNNKLVDYLVKGLDASK